MGGQGSWLRGRGWDLGFQRYGVEARDLGFVARV